MFIGRSSDMKVAGSLPSPSGVSVLERWYDSPNCSKATFWALEHAWLVIWQTVRSFLSPAVIGWKHTNKRSFTLWLRAKRAEWQRFKLILSFSLCAFSSRQMFWFSPFFPSWFPSSSLLSFFEPLLVPPPHLIFSPIRDGTTPLISWLL